MTTRNLNWPGLVVLRDRAQAAVRIAAELHSRDPYTHEACWQEFLLRCVRAGKKARDAAAEGGADGSGCFRAAMRAIDDEALRCFDGLEESRT